MKRATPPTNMNATATFSSDYLKPGYKPARTSATDEAEPSLSSRSEPYGDLVFDLLRAERKSESTERCRQPRNRDRERKASRDLRGSAPSAPETSDSIPRWKRILDLLVILLFLPLWLPLMILIMVAIKSTSAGPTLYRQERVGYRGRRFMLYKFRTMKVNVDTSVHESHFVRLIETDLPMTKLDVHGDPRLIKIGSFLRVTGFDELPQIFNVLRGEMSLVGARPCTVVEFEHYLPWQRDRVNGPPGITGYWQVNGKNKTTFSEMIEMDIFYAAEHVGLARPLDLVSNGSNDDFPSARDKGHDFA